MPFFGSASNPEGPVGAGIDVVLVQDGRVVGFATDSTISEDHQLEAVNVLGVHGPLFFKSMGYSANLDIGTYVLRERDNPQALWTPGYQFDGSYNLNTAGGFDFVIADVDTYTILATALNCKLATSSIQFPLRGLNTKATNFMATKVLPGIETS